MIISHIIGGLGNQMFQYAAGFRLAHALGVEYKIDVSDFETYKIQDYSLGTLSITAPVASERETDALKGRLGLLGRMARSSHRIDEPSLAFYPDLLNAKDGSYLTGYWQSEKYFGDVSAEIRKQFSVRDEIDAENAHIAAEIQNGLHVSIHIRRGDYITNKQAQSFHGSCSLDYYRDAAQYIFDATAAKDIEFVVFSDDPQWVKDNLRLEYPMRYVDHNGPEKNYLDMYLMSCCRHNIIANSSFSWWGAWLNSHEDKIVVAPKRWFVGKENALTKDLIPEIWVRL